MGLTNFPNGIQCPVVTGMYSPLWLPNGGTAYYTGGPNASDNNIGTDYDHGRATISGNVVSNVKNSSTGSVVAGTRGSGDFVYVSTGTYAENVQVVQRDFVRIIGAGRGLVTMKPADTPSTSTTAAQGTSVAITVPNHGTAQTNFAFIIGSRGVVVCGLTILVSSGTAAATGGFYIGDGGRINASNNWGASKFRIYDIDFDGQSTVNGGWAFCLDGCGAGGIIENTNIYGFRSGGLLMNSGLTRDTYGIHFRYNTIHSCRGYGIYRSTGMVGGDNVYSWNTIADAAGNNFTNGIFLGATTTTGDRVSDNTVLTAATPISVSLTGDRLGGNKTSTAGNATVTYVSMA